MFPGPKKHNLGRHVCILVCVLERPHIKEHPSDSAYQVGGGGGERR